MTPAVDLPVVLTIPSNVSYLRLVRLLVASMGVDAGFDIEAVEDLRIAADEIITALVGASTEGATITIETGIVDHELRLDATTQTGGEVVVGLDPLAAQILSALVDESSFVLDGAEVRATFRKAVAAS